MIFVITLIVLIDTIVIIIIIMIIITKRSHVSKILYCFHPFHHSLLLNSTNFSTSAN